MNFSHIDEELVAAVERKVFPGAVVLISHAGSVVYHRAVGSRSIDPQVSPLSEATSFDLA